MARTPGGAHLEIWGPYVRVYLRAAIGTGYVLEVGPPDTQDRLDAGNVLGFELDTEPDEPLWIDLSSRCTGITVTGGCTSPNGVRSQADAATLNAEIWDPEANLDPLNPDSVWTLGDLTGWSPVSPSNVSPKSSTPRPPASTNPSSSPAPRTGGAKHGGWTAANASPHCKPPTPRNCSTK